ncbi:potassium voltage-gated channel protein Shaw-like isoform X2 [Littorina saxatilis]|uniref:BTB domain-containing protein n=2 Tax=Littorina saxatilis TaxID=31220 RepID=A0AAN9GHC2_9CAEN
MKHASSGQDHDEERGPRKDRNKHHTGADDKDDLQHLDEDEEEDEEDEDFDDADWSSRPLKRVGEWRGCGQGRKMDGKHSRAKDKQSVLAALLPGSEIRGPSHCVLVNTGATRELLKFNIGGTIFETYRSTLHKLPHSPLADDGFLRKYYQEARGQYFFDRDPEVFGAILNYLRTGEFHLPTKYCGPAMKTEMEFWGIEEDEIEECCWNSYSAWTSTLEALQKLEKDRKVNMPGSVELFLRPGEKVTKCRRIQIKGWNILNNPHSSIYGQIYSYVSLTFVVISIFSFIAQTHEVFRVDVETPTGTNATVNLTTGNANTTGINATESGASSTTASSPVSDVDIRDDVHPAMLYIDAACLAYFLTEFALRFVFSPRKCKLLMLPMTVFELLALLPDLIEFGVRLFYPALGTMAAVDVINFLRLLRVFRIFRLMRHFPGLWILFYTLKASAKELLLLLLFLCVGMLFFASLIYYTDDREVFTSIPMACWWSIITMTTVGYGDIYPTSGWGYVIGSMTAICGVLVIGFTVPVLVNNFILYYQHTQCAISREGAKKRREEVKQNIKTDEEALHAAAASPTAALSASHGVTTLSDGVKNADDRQAKMERLRKLHVHGFPEESGVNPVDSVEFKERNGNSLSSTDYHLASQGEASQESSHL